MVLYKGPNYGGASVIPYLFLSGGRGATDILIHYVSCNNWVLRCSCTWMHFLLCKTDLWCLKWSIVSVLCNLLDSWYLSLAVQFLERPTGLNFWFDFDSCIIKEYATTSLRLHDGLWICKTVKTKRSFVYKQVM